MPLNQRRLSQRKELRINLIDFEAAFSVRVAAGFSGRSDTTSVDLPHCPCRQQSSASVVPVRRRHGDPISEAL